MGAEQAKLALAAVKKMTAAQTKDNSKGKVVQLPSESEESSDDEEDEVCFVACFDKFSAWNCVLTCFLCPSRLFGRRRRRRMRLLFKYVLMCFTRFRSVRTYLLFCFLSPRPL